jgi:alkylphosphonate utilization operon protein PhnA
VDHHPSEVKQRGWISITGSARFGLACGIITTQKPDRTIKGKFMTVKDSNGAELKDGDNVTLIKDLKVKGANTTLKRGTLIKGIRLTNDEDEIDCRHEKIKGLVLRTEFVKKA